MLFVMLRLPHFQIHFRDIMSLSLVFDRGKFIDHNIALRGPDTSPYAVKLFADAGREHMEKYGTTVDHFSKIAEKNDRHASNNKNSSFRKIYSLQEIKDSPMIHSPVQLLACCPNSDGAAAAVLCSEDFVVRHGL